MFISKKKKSDLKSPNIRGNFHIHIAMQRVILTKFFKPTHLPKMSK